MRYLSILILMLFASSVPDKEVKIAGTVRDAEGAAIGGARIVVHWDSTRVPDNIGIKDDMTTTSDREGKFSLELPPGFYDVCVMANVFLPQCDKIRLKNKDVKSYTVKLKISEIVLKEMN